LPLRVVDLAFRDKWFLFREAIVGRRRLFARLSEEEAASVFRAYPKTGLVARLSEKFEADNAGLGLRSQPQ